MEPMISAIRKILPQPVFRALQPAYHFALACAAAAWYRFPSRRLTVIGVTGTKGKTTVVHLAQEILQASGATTASLSSVRFKIGEREEVNELKMTMPGRFFVQRFLRRAVRAGCRYAVIEVTSQGIAQSRHRGICFAGAVMTNVVPEHIESHGSFEKYTRAKLDLFWRLAPEAVAIINRNDPAAGRFAAATRGHIIGYARDGIKIGNKVWRVKDREVGENGIAFDLGDQAFTSGLRGEFNFYNILAAVAVGLSRRIPLAKIAEAVSRFSGVPGRMEFIRRKPFSVVVDYAHTPDSLRKVYAFLKESGISNFRPPISNQEKGKLICVLGAAGGGRDRWKRPEFGRIAEQYCAEVFLTDEDPYDENPQVIIEEIAGGFLNPSVNAHKIIDRREAIRAALRVARAGDRVVITGKGAEPWMMVRDGAKIPWDDRQITREELQKLR